MKRRKPDRRDHVPVRDLTNDTVVNVARLLQETTGAKREYRLSLDWFALDTDLMARDITGTMTLMRIADGIMLSGKIQGVALIECVRCLEIYDQPFTAELEQEYRSIYEVAMASVGDDEDADFVNEIGEIDEANEIDMAEPIRQFAILSLPMRPDCGEDCPGPDIEEEAEPKIDHRMAVLAELLDDAGDLGDS
ncbi:MAG: DUF177 domain-containing protein [Thermomicrobiales bacterium]